MKYVRRLQVMHLKDDLKVLEDQIGRVEQKPVDGGAGEPARQFAD